MRTLKNAAHLETIGQMNISKRSSASLHRRSLQQYQQHRTFVGTDTRLEVKVGMSVRFGLQMDLKCFLKTHARFCSTNVSKETFQVPQQFY